jgi:glycine cleavage system H protein
VGINPELANAPEKINSDPHSAWMVRIQLANPGEVSKLLSSDDYEKYVKEEGGH